MVEMQPSFRDDIRGSQPYHELCQHYQIHPKRGNSVCIKINLRLALERDLVCLPKKFWHEFSFFVCKTYTPKNFLFGKLELLEKNYEIPS